MKELIKVIAFDADDTLWSNDCLLYTSDAADEL